MAIFRIQKNENYTVMSNYHLRDMNLSLKAKGLMSLMLSLPDNWDYSVQGLVSILKEGRETVDGALRELKENRYLIVTKYQDQYGRFDYIYDLYERPEESYFADVVPVGDLPGAENPILVNQQQINKEEQNKEEINTDSLKEKNTKKEKSKEPTLDEALKEYQVQHNLSPDVMEALNAFINMRKKIKKPMSLYSLKLLIKRLIELSHNDQTEMKMILDQSIFNGWQGIFALKKDFNFNPAESRSPNIYKYSDDVLEQLRKKYEAEDI